MMLRRPWVRLLDARTCSLPFFKPSAQRRGAAVSPQHHRATEEGDLTAQQRGKRQRSERRTDNKTRIPSAALHRFASPFGITTSGGAAAFDSMSELVSAAVRSRPLVSIEAEVATDGAADNPPFVAAAAAASSSPRPTARPHGPTLAHHVITHAPPPLHAPLPSHSGDAFSPHQSRIDTARAAAPSLRAVWNATENWCTLCKEPLNSWNEHRGKRDHICLEMFYDELVEYSASWSTAATRNLRRYLSNQLFTVNSAMREHAKDERRRRAELLHILNFLFEQGVLKRGRVYCSSTDFAAHQTHGAMTLFRHQYPAITAMFPHSTAAQISGLTQMCASLYNCETVFDLCGLRELVGDDAPVQGTITTQQGEVSDVGYTYKGTFLRSILGQLRFCLDEQSVAPPTSRVRGTRAAPAVMRRPSSVWTPAGAATRQPGRGSSNGGDSDIAEGGSHDVVPAHLRLLGKIAAKTLIAELIFCRTCEYICRVEPVWRDHVLSATPPVPAAPLPQTVTPRLSNFGAFCYLNGELHNRVVVDKETRRPTLSFTSGLRHSKLSGVKQALVARK